MRVGHGFAPDTRWTRIGHVFNGRHSLTDLDTEQRKEEKPERAEKAGNRQRGRSTQQCWTEGENRRSISIEFDRELSLRRRSISTDFDRELRVNFDRFLWDSLGFISSSASASPGDSSLFIVKMNSMTFSSGAPPTWFPIVPPDPSVDSSFWTSRNVHEHLKFFKDTIDLAKSMHKELEVMGMIKESGTSMEELDNNVCDPSVRKIFQVLKEKRISLEVQESQSLEVANSLISTLKSQLEPFNVLTSQTRSWEEKSAAAKLADKMQKYKRNKQWRKRKRKHIAEKLVKERERFDQADQEADEWRAREIAKDIARRKMEKMNEVAKLKANEERKRLESELELVLMVEKLQELRSIRIQKLKKQGHFLPEEDDKFLERVRAAVEEEERQAAAAADTDAAKDAIATAEESRKIIHSVGSDIKNINSNENEGMEIQGQASQATVSQKELNAAAVSEPRSEQGLEGQPSGGSYDSVGNLPLEFYHYYHGSNTDMGTLIEVRRTWDAYIRPGGSRIPGHWVQPPPPANEIWASYLINKK